MYALDRAYIAGVLHGDGWLTPLSLGLRCKDEDFAHAFARAVNRVMDTRIAVKVDERGYFIMRAGNRSGRFREIAWYDAEHDAESAAMWLRGLFDSEGNAQCLRLPRGTASFQRRIAFYSTNAGTLQYAARLLDVLGIDYTTRTTRNSASHIGTKTVFELSICRKPSFIKFCESVGSSIGRKAKTLERLVSTFQPDGWQARNWQKAIAARHPCTR